MANSYRTYKFGKNAKGQAIRSMNNGPWHIMDGITPKMVKDALDVAWPYNDSMQGKTLKEICSIDAEWLDMHIELLHDHLPHMKAARLLIRREIYGTKKKKVAKV